MKDSGGSKEAIQEVAASLANANEISLDAVFGSGVCVFLVRQLNCVRSSF